MHEFAEGKVGNQNGQEKQMDKEDNSYPFWDRGMEAHQPHDQLLDAGDIHPDEIPHQDAGGSQANDQKERKIVGGK
jgi:hypothetical protein